jgi:hypothetical protein
MNKNNNTMKKNIGTIDRAFRIILGLAIIGYGIYAQSWLGAIGAVPLLTGLIRFCPAYCPLGLSTVEKDGQGGGGGGCCGGGCCGGGKE